MKRKTMFVSHLVLAGLTVGLLAGGVPGANAAQPGGSGAIQTGASGGGKQSAPARPMTPVSSAFTYQGRLDDGPNPASGQYDFQFRLYDAAAGGNQVGVTVALANQTVVNGLFSLSLDFGMGAMQGDARWLEMDVRAAGGGTYTTMDNRIALTAVPYAMSLVPGSSTTGSVPGGAVLSASNTAAGYGIHGHSETTYAGVYGDSSAVDGTGVVGLADNSNGTGVLGVSPYGTGITGFAGVKGVYGLASASDGIGVHGVSNNGFFAVGVRGESATGYGGRFIGYYSGIIGTSQSGNGVEGRTTASNWVGVYGNGGANSTGVEGFTSSSNHPGVHGSSQGLGGTGVEGVANGGVLAVGVNGTSTDGAGVKGTSTNGIGVVGTTPATGAPGVFGFNSGAGYGVEGDSASTYAGVYGSTTNPNGTGVVGAATGAGAYAMQGINPGGVAGRFNGTVQVTGSLSKGGGSFKIDHPLDPANKYLYHSFVESPDMMNIYNGNVTTDGAGNATVTMPAWFDVLNRDFRYQLTVIGQFAQAIVSSEMKGNTFSIKTDKPNVRVSWQVTGIRQDPYANAHRIPVEENKTGAEKGKYLYPTEYGQPESKGIMYEDIQRLKQSANPGTQKP